MKTTREERGGDGAKVLASQPIASLCSVIAFVAVASRCAMSSVEPVMTWRMSRVLFCPSHAVTRPPSQRADGTVQRGPVRDWSGWCPTGLG